IAIGVAAPLACGGCDAEATGAEADTEAGAAVLAFAVLFGCVLRGEQADFILGDERNVLPGADAAALHGEVAVRPGAAGKNGDVSSGDDVGAGCGVVGGGALAAALAGADADADVDTANPLGDG